MCERNQLDFSMCMVTYILKSVEVECYMKFLERELVALNKNATSPEDAIRLAGNLLVDKGYANSIYVEAMMESYREHGPYFVIAPHIAMPHAKPEEGVFESSISLVKLDEPVVFGKEENDPVSLVFAIASKSADEHLENIQALVKLLSNDEYVDNLMQLERYEDLKEMLEEII